MFNSHMPHRDMPHRTTSASTGRLRSAGIAAGLLLAGVSATASAVDPSDGVYRIPYANGTEVKIGRDHVQHDVDSNAAIDMSGINGSSYTIVAAADGIIRFIEEDFDLAIDCDGVAASAKKNNYLWIEHANGEWSKYSHMRKGSSTAAGRSVGQSVVAGTALGIEDDVGCASGNHLHFEVAVPRATDPFTLVGGFLNDNSGSKRNRIPRICGIPTAYFVDNATYEARAVPGALAPGGKEVSRRNIAAQDYQCQVDQAILGGYQLEFVDGFNSGTNTYFNAVFRPQSDFLWGANHGQTVAGYTAKHADMIGRGFRLSHLESYHTANGMRYATVYTQAPGPLTSAYVDYDLEQHQNRRDYLIGLGYLPRNVSVLSSGEQLRYSAMYQKADFGAWQMKSTMTSAEYQTATDANKAAGRYPLYVNAYIHNGQPLFAAVWSSKALGLFKARHDLTSTQYGTEWASAMDADMLTRSVTGYVDDGVWRYAGIWRK